MSDSIKYTLGLKVTNSEHHEHLTIAFLDTTDIAKDDHFTGMLKFMKRNYPTKGYVNGFLYLGPENTKVYSIGFKDNEKAYRSLYQLWVQYNVAEPNKASTNIFIPHVTIKKGSKEREIGDEIEFGQIFVKRVGAYDPHFIFDLSEENSNKSPNEN